MGLKLHNCSGLHERDVPGVNACPGGSAAGGDQNGLNLRSATWSNDAENQLTSHTVPGYFEVVGQANPGATVTVNTLSTYRRGEYFRKEVTAANSSAPVYGANTVSAQWGTTNDTASGSQFVPQTPESFLYDPDGNLLRDGRWDYAWDAENRLIKLTTRTDVTVAPVRRLEFEYDWQGRRIGKKVYDARTGGTLLSTVRYLYDGWNLLVELNGSNAKVRGFVWGTDLSGSLQGAGGVGGLLKVTYYGTVTTNCFVGYDGNGNVTLLADAATGAVLAQYEYGPFGETIRITGPSTGSMAKANPFRFSTKYQDDETDLLYYGYRYYSPGLGRWLSRDPVEEDGGLNLYCLLLNGPLSMVDPLGLSFSDYFKYYGYHFWRAFFVKAPHWREVMDDWFFERGDPEHVYRGLGDPRNRDISTNTGFLRLLNCWAAKLRGDSVPSSSEWDVGPGGFHWKYGYWGFLGLECSAGGSAAYTDATHMLGSYTATLRPIKTYGNSLLVYVDVYNRSGWVSGTRTEGVPFVGWLIRRFGSGAVSFFKDHKRGEGQELPSSRGGNMQQHYLFTVEVDKCAQCILP